MREPERDLLKWIKALLIPMMLKKKISCFVKATERARLFSFNFATAESSRTLVLNCVIHAMPNDTRTVRRMDKRGGACVMNIFIRLEIREIQLNAANEMKSFFVLCQHSRRNSRVKRIFTMFVDDI